MYRVRKILSFFFFCQTVVWGTIRFATGEPAGVGHAVLPQSDTYLASVKHLKTVLRRQLFYPSLFACTDLWHLSVQVK